MKCLSLIVLSVLISACSGITSFQKNHQSVFIQPHHKVFISANLCNTLLCQSSSIEVHHKLTLSIKAKLESQGIQMASTLAEADYHLMLISAYEEVIDPNYIRNLYFLMLDRQQTEVAQFGLANNFSTPLQAPFVDFNNIEARFTEHFVTTVAPGVSVVSTSKIP
jgi:hypothetical protein